MNCSYVCSDGSVCQCEAKSKDLCEWHSRDNAESLPDIKGSLEARAKTGGRMDGFQLSRVDLSDIDLVNSGGHQGYQLINSDLYRCDLSHAHLFGLDLSGSSLMKANLEHANLHGANLENTNLLGVRMAGAKLEGINWGDKVLQEKLADQEADIQKKQQLYVEAEEIYRNLGRTMSSQGIVDWVGVFFYREKVARRKQFPLFSINRGLSKITDFYCGYGEKPLRLISFSFLLVLFFALLYSWSGLLYHGSIHSISQAQSFNEAVGYFFNAMYFSAVTFTTLGYGDFTPVGFSRVLASLEAFSGSFTLALFVVVFVRRLSR